MSHYKKIQSIKAQLIEIESLLEMVAEYPLMLMAINLKERIKFLKQELDSLPKESLVEKSQVQAENKNEKEKV